MKPLNTIKYETFIIGTCPNCGQARLNNRDNNFCGCCGTEIEWEQGCNGPGRALRKIGTSCVSESEHGKGCRFPDVWDGSPKVFETAGVTRCSDCKYWDKLVLNRDGDGVCRADNTILVTHPDWYCADGERRTDDA